MPQVHDLTDFGLTDAQMAELAANGEVQITVNGYPCMIVVDTDGCKYIHAGARPALSYPEHIPCPDYAPWQYVEGWLSFQARGRREDNPFMLYRHMEVEAKLFFDGYDARANLGRMGV